MIYTLRGKLLQKDSSLVVVECAGVGYGCKTTLYTQDQLGNIGDEVFLYTVMTVREDAVDLFGFTTQQERECFQFLTTVSSVGSKVALSILSSLTPEKFLLCVASNDSKELTKAKGVGAKMASRIVMELKDKVTSNALFSNKETDYSQIATPSGGEIADAIAALVSLGYSQSDVTPIVAKLDPTLPATDLIRLTLKEFGKNR